MPPIGSRPFQVYNKGEARSLGCAEGSIRMKTGLVLEGGGMRGMFTAGVLDAFYARGLHFDGVIGVSAGAACCGFGRIQSRYSLGSVTEPRVE